MAIASINPATGELTKRFDPHTDGEIESALDRAVSAFEKHRRSSFAERAAKLRHAAEMLEKDREHFARIITSEMGKLLRGSIDEIEKCARGCRFYAEHGEKFLSEQIVSSDARRSYVRYEPLGAVLAIMPWNFPFWQVFRFAAPALMAGNVGLLKHASNVPQCALAIEKIFREAGFDPGVFQTLLIENEAVEKIIRDPRVKAVTLTGSERAGSAVASAAGREVKKSVLELGGSDPFIVMPSAGLDDAISTGVKSRMVNSGQSCIAAKRFIIADAIYDQYLAQFVEKMKKLKLGDPREETTEVAPLSLEHILRGVDEQVQKSVAAGAKILCGGNALTAAVIFTSPRSSPRWGRACRDCASAGAAPPRAPVSGLVQSIAEPARGDPARAGALVVDVGDLARVGGLGEALPGEDAGAPGPAVSQAGKGRAGRSAVTETGQPTR